MIALTDALTAASALLGRRLFTTAWLPVLVLLAALAMLAGTGAGWPALWLIWEHLPVPAQFGIGLAALALSVVLAVLVAGLRMPLIRLFEGYWTALPYGGRLEEHYARSHQRAHEALTERHRRGGFPWPPGYPRTPGRVRPTRMGNALRAAEEHALLRYDIDSVTAWPRLYTVLPEGFRQEFTAAATSLDRAVVAAVLGAAFAVAGGLTAALSLPWYVVPAVVWAGMAVAWTGYLAAVRAATVYGDLVRAAFDLYRWKLLDEMGLSRPHGYEAERDLWVQVHKLWQEMGPDSDRAHLLGYPPDPAATPQPLAPPPTPAGPGPASPAPQPAPQPDAQPGAPEPSRIRRVIADLTLGSRLSFAVLGWTLFLGVVAALLTATRDDPPLAARELPAYHQLTAADLRGDPGDLPGRYTLRKIPAYGRLHPALLGPSLSPRAPGGAAITLKGRVATVVSVPAGATQSLQRGDHATLIAKKEPAIDVLVLDVLSADRVVLAMLPADLSGLANMPAPIQIAKHLN